MLSWHDPFLTLQLCMLLMVLYVALTAIGWLLYLIPWGFVFEWIFRLLGFAALGPHMYFVGLRIEAAQEQKRIEEEEFKSASDEQRAAILAGHKERMLAEAKAVLDAQVAKDE